MKKTFSIFLLILCVLIAPFTGCSNNNDNNKGSNKTSYYEDFKFLPKYPGAKKISYSPPPKDGAMGKGVYSIEEKDRDIATKKYKKILEDDGWKVNMDESTLYLDCSKGDHSAGIIISIKDDVPTIEFFAK